MRRTDSVREILQWAAISHQHASRCVTAV